MTGAPDVRREAATVAEKRPHRRYAMPAIGTSDLNNQDSTITHVGYDAVLALKRGESSGSSATCSSFELL
jgi:hypothetical protein